MPNWNQLLNETRSAGSIQDLVRRKYLAAVRDKTGRNLIVYYSGWLQKGSVPGTEINDDDKNGLMAVIHEMDRNDGLDLMLHTPGGEIAATESLVDYLRLMFGNDIRAIVPQIALSGGTMIACAAKEILMGKQSSLGPIDPQFSGIPAHGVVEEFNRAKDEIRRDRSTIPIWQPIINKYTPTLIGECEKAIAWSNEMTADLLRTGMFAEEDNPQEKIDRILQELGDHALTKSHARHLSASRCRDMGLHIVDLETDQDLQDAILSAHHACILSLSETPALKIIENHAGVAFIKIAQQVLVGSHPMLGQEMDHGVARSHPAAWQPRQNC